MQVLMLEKTLQVQQCPQSCLYTSIKRCVRKFSLRSNDQLLDVIIQLVYAYSRLWSAIDFLGWRLWVSRSRDQGWGGLWS